MAHTPWRASIVLGDPIEQNGIRLLQGVAERWSGSDRTVVARDRGGKACHYAVPMTRTRTAMGYWRGAHEEAEGADGFICLAVENPPQPVFSELYLTIEFFETELGWIAAQFIPDGETGFVHHVCAWDRQRDGRAAYDPTWVNTSDSNTWHRATIRLVKPTLTGSGPFSADLKIISSGPLYLREVALSTERPADFADTDQLAHARRVERLQRPKYPEAHVPVSVGNIVSIFEDHDPQEAHDVAPWLPIYRAMGVTAIQSYVRWSSIERVEGTWDWSRYDWVVQEAKKFGLKWVAFIMIGPWYAMPKWWLESPNNRRNKCLEHDQESWVQSIWNPVLLDYVDRFMMKFAEHYPEQVIESIMVGIAGDFGESTTNGVFNRDLYHTHVGYWCGEDVALDDIRRAMKAKYGSIRRLNAAWDTNLGSFDDVRPVLREDCPSDRRWLDQTNWYVDRMTWWMQRWGEICRKALPDTALYNACGGAGDPPRASHWTDQTKALQQAGMGQRVTNEGGDYAFNYAYTGWPAVCCRFYGTPFGNEPWGGDMSGNGVLGRIYNAITMGGGNYWFYQGHIRPPAGRLALEHGLPFMNGQYRRTNRVAVYYPWTHFVLMDEHGFSERGMRDRFWPQIEELRDITDFDLVDDHLIRDGIMRQYDFLIVMQGTAYERDELERLVGWVESGGVLITHNLGIPTTVEGDSSLGEKLLAFDDAATALETKLGARVGNVGAGRVVMFPRSANVKGWKGDDRWKEDHKDHPATHPQFWTMLTETLFYASQLGTGLADYPIIDGAKDEVYGALAEHAGELGALYFSQVERDVTVRPRIPGKGTREVVVPAGQMTYVAFDCLRQEPANVVQSAGRLTTAAPSIS